MATGPGEELAAAGRGHLRASHADREQAIEALKAGFVQGRLTKGEFDARVGQTLASRTCAELATVTADLPAGPAVTRPRAPAGTQGWLTMRRAVTLSACMLIPTAAATVAGGVLGGRLDPAPAILLSFLAFFVATVAAGTLIGEAWEKDRRSSGQPPRGPAPDGGGQVSRGPGSAAGGGRLPRSHPGQQDTALAVPSGPARSRLPGARLPRQPRLGGLAT